MICKCLLHAYIDVLHLSNELKYHQDFEDTMRSKIVPGKFRMSKKDEVLTEILYLNTQHQNKLKGQIDELKRTINSHLGENSSVWRTN